MVFKKSLPSCVLDKSSLSIRRVKTSIVSLATCIEKLFTFNRPERDKEQKVNKRASSTLAMSQGGATPGKRSSSRSAPAQPQFPEDQSPVSNGENHREEGSPLPGINERLGMKLIRIICQNLYFVILCWWECNLYTFLIVISPKLPPQFILIIELIKNGDSSCSTRLSLIGSKNYLSNV